MEEIHRSRLFFSQKASIYTYQEVVLSRCVGQHSWTTPEEWVLLQAAPSHGPHISEHLPRPHDPYAATGLEWKKLDYLVTLNKDNILFYDKCSKPDRGIPREINECVTPAPKSGLWTEWEALANLYNRQYNALTLDQESSYGQIKVDEITSGHKSTTFVTMASEILENWFDNHFTYISGCQ